jgi:hypothetical protein
MNTTVKLASDIGDALIFVDLFLTNHTAPARIVKHAATSLPQNLEDILLAISQDARYREFAIELIVVSTLSTDGQALIFGREGISGFISFYREIEKFA